MNKLKVFQKSLSVKVCLTESGSPSAVRSLKRHFLLSILPAPQEVGKSGREEEEDHLERREQTEDTCEKRTCKECQGRGYTVSAKELSFFFFSILFNSAPVVLFSRGFSSRVSFCLFSSSSFSYSLPGLDCVYPAVSLSLFLQEREG